MTMGANGNANDGLDDDVNTDYAESDVMLGGTGSGSGSSGVASAASGNGSGTHQQRF